MAFGLTYIYTEIFIIVKRFQAFSREPPKIRQSDPYSCKASDFFIFCKIRERERSHQKFVTFLQNLGISKLQSLKERYSTPVFAKHKSLCKSKSTESIKTNDISLKSPIKLQPEVQIRF